MSKVVDRIAHAMARQDIVEIIASGEINHLHLSPLEIALHAKATEDELSKEYRSIARAALLASENLKVIWQRMIDAALKEETSGV